MRRIIVLTLLGLVAAGCTASTPTPVVTRVPVKSGKLRYFHLLNVDLRYVPTFMALDDLRSQGYTVETVSMANSTLIVEALARGDADMVSLNPQTMWTGIAKGVNARSIVQGINAPLFIFAKQDIKTCRDLDRRPVAQAAATGLSPTLLDKYIKQNCPESKPKFLAISETTGRVAALMAGEVDAALLSLDDVLDLESKNPGKFYRLIDFSKEFPEIPC